ncbi:MAG: DNA-3-methyladenine glycosylase I [Rubrivivax sp.]|nr:MAG: DNA-3-methyladenine glycosylase I [Rubrivivax sp.]
MTEPDRRCRWVGDDPQMIAYHDEEWGVPQRDSRQLWETLMLECFQAGLSWSVILRKREGFRQAFAGFDPKRVARFTEHDVERLMQDAGIVRSRAKIQAMRTNAEAFLRMQAAGEDFATWAWGMVDGQPVPRTGPTVSRTALSERLSHALRQRGFKFAGPVIVHAWMQAAGLVDDHDEHCGRHRASP